MNLTPTQFQAVENGWLYTFSFNPYANGWSAICRREGTSPIPTMMKTWTTKGWVHSLRKVGGDDVYFATTDEAIATITDPEDQ